MGVVLYEMLALVQPFTASNVAALHLGFEGIGD